MLYLDEIPDFRKFLSSVFAKATKNEIAGRNQIFEYHGVPWFEKLGPRSKITKSSFWFDHLVSYKMIDAFIHEDFTYYAGVRITLQNEQKSDLFIDVGFLIVNTNYGVMVLFFDENCSIHKLELNFRVEKRMPPFLYDLIKHFPRKNSKLDSTIVKNIDELGTLPIDNYLRKFRRTKLRMVKVD